jgi:4'-phosphopantetheinyl transferase EntD
MAQLGSPEKQYVSASVDKRKAEFSTGRVLAARALDALDIPRRAIPKGDHNEPVWPDGVVGSITHNTKTCVVVLARDNVCGGIGVDVENLDADVGSVSRMIMRADELSGLVGQHDDQFHSLVRLTFSAKESVFKAIFPLVRRFVDFDEVRISYDQERQTFFARAPENTTLDGVLAPGSGGYRNFADFLATGFYLPGNS